MVISRIINGVEIDVDINSGTDLFFDENDLEQIGIPDITAINEYLFRKKGMYFPGYVVWELTNNCNFSCPFCYVHTNNHRASNFKNWGFYRELIDDLVDKGMLFCTLTGGECLMHPFFSEIYSYLKKSGVLVTLFTNGSLLSRDHFDLFSELPPYKIEVSIYGLSDTQFMSVTHVPARMKHNVLANIIRLQTQGIHIVCKTPINKLTIMDQAEIIDWCQSHHIEYYSSSELVDSYDGTSMRRYALPSYLQDREDNALYQSSNVVQTKQQFGFRKAFTCPGGQYSAVITHDNKLQPCFSAHGMPQYSYSIENRISSALAQLINVLENERGKKLPSCKGCIFHDVCKKCILDEAKGENASFCHDFYCKVENTLNSIPKNVKNKPE